MTQLEKNIYGLSILKRKETDFTIKEWRYLLKNDVVQIWICAYQALDRHNLVNKYFTSAIPDSRRFEGFAPRALMDVILSFQPIVEQLCMLRLTR